MRGSFWETIKDAIPFKEFDEWLNNQAIFRTFLQKEAVKKMKCYTQKPNLNYLFAHIPPPSPFSARLVITCCIFR
jgi:hypothetical protein